MTCSHPTCRESARWATKARPTVIASEVTVKLLLVCPLHLEWAVEKIVEESGTRAEVWRTRGWTA